MPNTRINYIDVAKGLLILMVVLPHISQVVDMYSIKNDGGNDSYFLPIMGGIFHSGVFLDNGNMQHLSPPDSLIIAPKH